MRKYAARIKVNWFNSAFVTLIMVLILFILPFQLTAEESAVGDDVQMIFTLDSNTYTVNGTEVVMDTSPVIIENRTMLPVRFVAEPLGADVQWDGIESKVTVSLADVTMELWIGQAQAMVNGATVAIDPDNLEVKPIIIDDRTMLPVRFVTETLGCDVGWDPLTSQVSVAKVMTDGEDSDIANRIELKPIIPDWVLSGLSSQTIFGDYDSAVIYWDKLEAKESLDYTTIKVDPDYKVWDVTQLKQQIFWETGCDYSPYVTFQGNQDGFGGCIGRSMIHIMNIMKEREIPYTPDVSFWYLQSRQEQLADGGAINTKAVLSDNGIAPEASAPSDYDKMVIRTNSAGDRYADYSEMWGPNGWTNTLAMYYRMLESDSFLPTIDNIRYALVNYGPVLAGGNIVQIQGSDPVEGHAVTIVGYDDVLQEVKILNSYGDTWGPTNNGYFTMKYSDLASNFEYARFYLIIPVDRIGTTQDYSARIHIETGSTSRNKLKVTIGLGENSPFTVWDTPNETVIVDNSKTLKLDVPLPVYAVDHWPPESGTNWYVKVENTSTSDSAIMKEITLARLYKDVDNNNAVETFSSQETGSSIGPGETKMFYIPKQKFSIIDPTLPNISPSN